MALTFIHLMIKVALVLDSVMDQKSFGSVIVESLSDGLLKTLPIRLVVKNLLWYCPGIGVILFTNLTQNPFGCIIYTSTKKVLYERTN